MIDVIMQMGTELIIVRIKGHDIVFGAKTSNNPMMAPIDGLQISKQGAIKEFPDLKDNPLWREEAIKRFKNKIKSLDDEEEIYDYIVTDLQKYGWIPKYRQKQGFRIEVLNAS